MNLRYENCLIIVTSRLGRRVGFLPDLCFRQKLCPGGATPLFLSGSELTAEDIAMEWIRRSIESSFVFYER